MEIFCIPYLSTLPMLPSCPPRADLRLCCDDYLPVRERTERTSLRVDQGREKKMYDPGSCVRASPDIHLLCLHSHLPISGSFISLPSYDVHITPAVVVSGCKQEKNCLRWQSRLRVLLSWISCAVCGATAEKTGGVWGRAGVSYMCWACFGGGIHRGEEEGRC